MPNKKATIELDYAAFATLIEAKPSAARVFCILADRAGAHGTTIISQAELAKLTGCCTRTAMRAVSDLATNGWIAKHDLGKGAPRLYAIQPQRKSRAVDMAAAFREYMWERMDARAEA